MSRKDEYGPRSQMRPLSQPQNSQFDVVTEPGPCDGCPQAATCRNRHLACMAFAQYVRSGRCQTNSTLRVPTRQRYLRLFTDDGDNSSYAEVDVDCLLSKPGRRLMSRLVQLVNA